jgi:hypothetical protein
MGKAGILAGCLGDNKNRPGSAGWKPGAGGAQADLETVGGVGIEIRCVGAKTRHA